MTTQIFVKSFFVFADGFEKIKHAPGAHRQTVRSRSLTLQPVMIFGMFAVAPRRL